MLRRLCAVALAAAVLPGPVEAQPPTDREVTIDGGIAPLHAALLVPEHRTTAAAVLMLEGSGGTDRNGDQASGVKRGANKRIAQGLAAAGVVTLRIDKRCVGESQLACPGEEKLLPQTYVDDAVAWAKFLRAQPGVRCVVIYGHSEGALIGDLAAARTPVCGVVSAAGIGRPSDVVLREQLAHRGASATTLAKIDEIQAELKAGRRVADVPPMLAPLYRASIQAYLISEFRIDPAAAAAAVKAPMLILQGAKDAKVGVVDAKLLAAAHPGAELLILPNAIHSLQDEPPPGTPDTGETWPLDPAVVPAVADFVRRAGGG